MRMIYMISLNISTERCFDVAIYFSINTYNTEYDTIIHCYTRF